MKVRNIRNRRMRHQSQMLATINANLGLIERKRRREVRHQNFIKYAKFAWYWTRIGLITLAFIFFIIVAMQLS